MKKPLKSVNIQVKRQIWNQVCQACRQVNDHVWHHARTQIDIPVSNQVWNEVWTRLFNKIWPQIK